MKSLLDVLTKAANFVENQEQENKPSVSKATIPAPTTEVRYPITENGDSGEWRVVIIY